LATGRWGCRSSEPRRPRAAKPANAADRAGGIVPWRSSVGTVPARPLNVGPLDGHPLMIAARVSRLDHSTASVAAAIHGVMMAAYRLEAELLGVEDFPPLRRTPAEIAGVASRFLGITAAGVLVAVVELETVGPAHVQIHSLVVTPAYCRRGLATALLRAVVGAHADDRISVYTGALNRRALRLYAAAGFHEQDRWATPEGIAMVTLYRGSGCGRPFANQND
jgi:GNAT superfamily N-acetyltransferase